MEIMKSENIQTNPKLMTPAPITGPSTQFPPAPPSPHLPPSPTSPHSTTNSGLVPVVSPCAACKILRRRCVEKCLLAPYFPPTDPCKFTIAHRVFGAANIIKFLQELPESNRADAVNSMVYEANARLRDPVYGCAGAICRLQERISELQAELARTQAEAVSLQCLNSNLSALLCVEMAKLDQAAAAAAPAVSFNGAVLQQQQQYVMDTSCLLDESSLSSGWEPLWA